MVIKVAPNIYIYYVLPLSKTITVAPEGDIYVKLADQVLEAFSIAGQPGAFLVDWFPSSMSPPPSLQFSTNDQCLK
jgi:hypothetical protein